MNLLRFDVCGVRLECGAPMNLLGFDVCGVRLE
jgi:hypothetical protein